MVVRSTTALLLTLLVVLIVGTPGSADHRSDTARYTAGGHVSQAAGLVAPGACYTPNDGSDATAVLNCLLQCPTEGATCTIDVQDDQWGPWGAWSRCMDGTHEGYGQGGTRTIPNTCEKGHIWVWPDLGATTGIMTTS